MAFFHIFKFVFCYIYNSYTYTYIFLNVYVIYIYIYICKTGKCIKPLPQCISAFFYVVGIIYIYMNICTCMCICKSRGHLHPGSRGRGDWQTNEANKLSLKLSERHCTPLHIYKCFQIYIHMYL